MKKILLWIPTSIFALLFGLVLLVFHLLQVIALQMGYKAHNRIANIMAWAVNSCLLSVGSNIKFENLAGDMPTDKPMIIVSNHQSMFDITAINWVLRKHHPKFISKKSLEKGIPSVSYNIRNGGSITIDRKNPRKAIKAIEKFGNYLNENNRAGCIFAEGTRSKDGKILPFKPMGLLKLLRTMPEATVVPVAIQNFWQLSKNKMMPMPFGVPLVCTVLPPIDRSVSDKEIIKIVEEQISKRLENQID